MSLVSAKCTNCGARIEVDPTTEAGICPYCNSAYVTQKAIVNYNVTILNNTTIHAASVNVLGDNFDNLMMNARDAWEGKEYQDAFEKYSRALDIQPSNEEAILYKSLCLGWLKSNFVMIYKSFDRVYGKIDINSESKEHIENLNRFICEVYTLIQAYYVDSLNSYNPDYHNSDNIEMVWERIETVVRVLNDIIIPTQRLIKERCEEYKENYLTYLKLLHSCYHELSHGWKYDTHTTGGLIDIRRVEHEESDEFEDKAYEILQEIRILDPNYKPPKKRGCYIATSVYGSYDCPQVWVLRRYRDYKLDKTILGRAFIKLYYTFSPMLVKKFGKSKWFQSFWKFRLDKMVERLKLQGYEDTPYYDNTSLK